MSDYDVQLGARMREARDATGLTLDDVAEALCCTRPAVGHWESGRRGLRAEQLAVVAKLLGADPGWLLTGERHLSASDAHRIRAAAKALAGVAEILDEVMVATAPDGRRASLNPADQPGDDEPVGLPEIQEKADA